MSAHGEKHYWTDTGRQPQAPTGIQRELGAPAVEAPTLRKIQGRYRTIIRKAESLRKRGYSHKCEHEEFSSDFKRVFEYLRTIEENRFQLPFCSLLKTNDIRAVMRAFADGWGSGTTERAMISNVSFIAFSLAVGGDSTDIHNEVANDMTGREERCKAVEGDPNVAIGPRALQFNRFLSHMIAISTAGDVLLNRLLNPDESNPLSRQEKLALSKAINGMKKNFPRKVREKVYRGPKAEDEYKIVRTPIRYNDSHSLKTVISNLIKYIGRKIDAPSKYLDNNERRAVMRCLKRVADETTESHPESWRSERSEGHIDLLFKTYLNAAVLFTHNRYESGFKEMEVLQDMLLDCWPKAKKKVDSYG